MSSFKFNTVNFCTFPGQYFAHSCIKLSTVILYLLFSIYLQYLLSSFFIFSIYYVYCNAPIYQGKKAFYVKAYAALNPIMIYCFFYQM